MHTIAQFESNPVPLPFQPAGQGALADAFSCFVSAADVLERSYRDLQDELARLRLELQESNLDLDRSLRENERMKNWLGGIVESLPCGVVVLDETGHPRLQNQEAVKLLEGGHARNFKVFSSAARQKCGREYDYELPGPAGERSFSIKRAQLAAREGAAGESVMIVRETTEQRRMEKEREAGRRVQALAEISAMLAHEIRNPLASMELFASLLYDSLDPAAEQSEWVQQIRSGLRLLSATVNNVLQFYSESAVQLFPLQLSELVKTTISLLNPIARQHRVDILFAPEVHDGVIDGDTHKLQQVFFNLAVNAFRAMTPGHTLTIALCQHTSRTIRVEFRDQGCGIATRDLDRIFEPGFSGSSRGPGLGLTVCKRIVEQHGGTISVLSAPSVGSTFTLEFPVIGDGE